jgi:hypothetical protein
MTRPSKACVVTAGVLAALMLSGCGGSDQGNNAATGASSPASATKSTQPDACRLITTDEVAQVLSDHSADHATYSVTATTGPDGSCTYAWRANGGGDEFTVNEFPAKSHVPQPGVEPRPIAGIGDEAFEEVGSFYVRVGDEMVNVVNVQEGEGSDEDLLRIAAGRLGS